MDLVAYLGSVAGFTTLAIGTIWVAVRSFGRRFEDVNRRLDEVNDRFGDVNSRFDDVNTASTT